MNDKTDIATADPKARRRNLIILLAAMVFGAGGLFLFTERLKRLTANPDPGQALAELRLIITYCAIINGLLSNLIGGWLLSFGIRTLAAEQFPPPGAKVIVDTPIKRGRLANKPARSLIGAGLVIISTNIPTIFMVWMIGQFI